MIDKKQRDVDHRNDERSGERPRSDPHAEQTLIKREKLIGVASDPVSIRRPAASLQPLFPVRLLRALLPLAPTVDKIVCLPANKNPTLLMMWDLVSALCYVRLTSKAKEVSSA